MAARSEALSGSYTMVGMKQAGEDQDGPGAEEPRRSEPETEGPGRAEAGGRGSPIFTGGVAPAEPRNWKAVGIAGAAVLLVLVVLLLVGRHARQAANPGGAGLAPPAAYAASLPITGVQMSDSSNLSGGKETYLDGTVTNRGTQTVHAVTVQIAFKDFTGLLAGKETLPLNLIRFREPYVDTEPVSAEPIAPGQSRPFRLIFDATPESWDGAYPEVRVIAVESRAH